MDDSVIQDQNTSNSSKQSQSIYALGSNGSGQLGIGHSEDVSHPSLVQVNLECAQVKRIASGGNHTLLLTHDGRVFSAGNDEDGRCGHGGIGTINSMKLITTPKQNVHHFTEVAASWSASYFLMDDKITIFACGTGEHGELALGSNVTTTTEMRKITIPNTEARVIQMTASVSHAVVLLSKGQIWGWGRGRKGQLGQPNEDAWNPRKLLDISFAASRLACGVDFTCILGKATEGRIALFGCESRDRFNVKADTPSSLFGWRDVTASWASIYVLLNDGTLRTWGRNDHGQLPVLSLPAVELFAAGSEHWIAISSNGQVLTAGWSEHGNCGIPSDASGVVRDGWNHLSVSNKPISVYAGCATSFIVVEQL